VSRAALEETAEILSDDGTLAAIRQGLSDIAADDVALDDVRENARTLVAYNAQFDRFAEACDDTPGDDLRTWLDYVLSLIPLGSPILEIGSGTSRDADYIESRGYTVRRTDGSSAAVEFMRSRGRSAEVLNVLTDDLGGPHCAIIANAVLPHFTADDAAAIIERMHDALHPGGVLAFTLKHGSGAGWTNVKLDMPRFFTYWDVDSARRLLTSHGFTVDRVAVVTDPREAEWLYVTARSGRPV
jgi:SAM-dependent methyltransferase